MMVCGTSVKRRQHEKLSLRGRGFHAVSPPSQFHPTDATGRKAVKASKLRGEDGRIIRNFVPLCYAFKTCVWKLVPEVRGEERSRAHRVLFPVWNHSFILLLPDLSFA